jgi:hypothetical protein
MRWPIARNRVSTPTSSTASVQAAGPEVRAWDGHAPCRLTSHAPASR